MRVWIDLSNSPHPLLFAPVARELEADGHEVLVTARDNAQTAELARRQWSEVEVIGGQSPPARVAKAKTIWQRVVDLCRWARDTRPDIALSHNSYAQILAARLLRIPSVTAMDYEHQPANHVAFRLARTVMLPEALPLARVRHQGATAAKVKRYPGLKEEVYVGEFEPDSQILALLGLDPRPPIVAIARTPPSRALYHKFGNPLFEEALRALCSRPDVACVTLARYPEQRAEIQALGLERCLVPHEAIDSRSLIYAADAMIGAGGTMTREAALIGIPTWTIFAGKAAAVDEWLEHSGSLKRLEAAQQLRVLCPRPTDPRTPAQLRERARAITTAIVHATLDARAPACVS